MRARIIVALAIASTAAVAVAVFPAGAALAAGPAPTLTEPDLTPAIVTPEAGGGWQGGYAGIQLGYGFGELNLDPTDIGDLDSNGLIGGFHVGYLWTMGSLVAGPELQYDRADLSVRSPAGGGSFDEIARVKMRVGADLAPGLLYGSAGAAYANFDGLSGVTDIVLDDPGYILGFGYDYAVNDDWTLGGEYQYHMFKDFGADGNDVDLQTIHLRASYNF